MSRAIESGVDYGYMRAHKHTDTPDEARMKNEMFSAIMNELSEILFFDTDNNNDTGNL